MMINDIVSPATGSSEENSASGQPILLAGRGRTLPPGYIHLGVSKEIAPTLRRFRRRARSGHPGGGARSPSLRRRHERHPPYGLGPAAYLERGSHELPAFRASGRSARHDPVPRHGGAPDAAFRDPGRRHACSRVEPEHPESGRRPVAHDQWRCGLFHLLGLPARGGERGSDLGRIPRRRSECHKSPLRLSLEPE